MLNKEIPKIKLKGLKMLILDSDGVCVPRGTFIIEKETNNFYEAEIKTYKITDDLAEIINQLKNKIKICISSGRGLIYVQSIYSKIIGRGVSLQAENGSLSLVEGKIVQHFDYNENYFRKIAIIKEKIKKLSIKGIKGFEPKQFILSVHAEREIPEIYEVVKKNDLENELEVMWNGEAFDIQKKILSKGEGLKKLAKLLKIQRQEIIAMGDRINDKELLETAGIGVSADQEVLKAEYWTIGKGLPGEILVKYLLKNI